MTEVIPGILDENEEELERKVMLAALSAPRIQIDISDETLTSVKSLTDFLSLQRIMRPYREREFRFDAHLISRKPELFLPALTDAGFTSVAAPVECDDPREFIADARTHEIEIGLTLDLDTGVEVVEPFLEEIDFVLVMGTEVDTKGQVFQPDVLEKIKTIHRNFPDLPIAVEGGMTPKTAHIVSEAGATRIIGTSYLFDGKHTFPDAYSSFDVE